MSRKKQKQTQTPEELNRAYFQSLIATRSSLGALSVSLAGIFINLIVLAPVWGTGLDLGWNPPYNLATMVLLVSLVHFVLSQLVVLIEPVRRFFYEHQRFSSVWQLVFLLNILVVMLYLSGLLTIVDQSGRIDIYGSRLTVVYLLFAGIVYTASIVYNIFWLHGQLQTGMSEERRFLNYFAKPSVYSLGSIVFILVGILLARYFSTGIFTILIGLSATVLFILAFSRFHVEYGYAAILKWRDKSYWEEYDEEDGLSLEGKKKLRRLGFTIAEVLVIIGITYLTNMDELPRWILGLQLLIIFSIFADWLWWLIRKAMKLFFRG